MSNDEHLKEEIIKGRGAQINPDNPFDKNVYEQYYEDLIYEEPTKVKTKYLEVFPKTIVNKVDSPDVPVLYSMNPYQGCEHGCIYCYARNTHPYWGYSAGIEFESNILVKKNAPALLTELFEKKSWKASPIMISGNTDCYQPAEKQFELTRAILSICLKYRHPVSIITKNALILRDLDIISSLAKDNLVQVMISITSLNESLRRKLEPRTSTAVNRLKIIEILAQNNVPTGVMIAPIIPAINDSEIMDIARAASTSGAVAMGSTMIRLNGQIDILFRDWLNKHFPSKAKSVINKIKSVHNGRLNDSRMGARMRGTGHYAHSIHGMLQLASNKYFSSKPKMTLNTILFEQYRSKQLRLFD